MLFMFVLDGKVIVMPNRGGKSNSQTLGGNMSFTLSIISTAF